MYFPARARGELARLLFAAAGKEFEDQRLTFEQWGPLKASKIVFTEYAIEASKS